MRNIEDGRECKLTGDLHPGEVVVVKIPSSDGRLLIAEVSARWINRDKISIKVECDEEIAVEFEEDSVR
ncbi:MAG: hypothetical protein ACK5XN_21735 [Bacteroidota bacterium]